MKKKTYFAPKVEVLHVKPINMLATSVGISNSTTDSDARMSRNRGDWDEFWD